MFSSIINKIFKIIAIPQNTLLITLAKSILLLIPSLCMVDIDRYIDIAVYLHLDPGVYIYFKLYYKRLKRSAQRNIFRKQ